MTMVDTPDGIAWFQLIARRSALRLEIAGMHRSGRSAYSICKSEYGLRGSRASVLAQLDDIIERAKFARYIDDPED